MYRTAARSELNEARSGVMAEPDAFLVDVWLIIDARSF